MDHCQNSNHMTGVLFTVSNIPGALSSLKIIRQRITPLLAKL